MNEYSELKTYDFDTAWSLLTPGYFSEDELQLVTRMNGCTMATSDNACRVRYGMDFGQLMEEAGWDEA